MYVDCFEPDVPHGWNTHRAPETNVLFGALVGILGGMVCACLLLRQFRYICPIQIATCPTHPLSLNAYISPCFSFAGPHKHTMGNAFSATNPHGTVLRPEYGDVGYL